jgi:peptidoglycan/LPS O-acetylase OafA/YrhL
LRYASNRIATYSYGIYLSHQFCIWLALGVLASHSLVLKIPLLVVMLATVPVILYHLIEAPMIKLGTRCAMQSFNNSAVTVRERRTHTRDT